MKSIAFNRAAVLLNQYWLRRSPLLWWRQLPKYCEAVSVTSGTLHWIKRFDIGRNFVGFISNSVGLRLRKCEIRGRLKTGSFPCIIFLLPRGFWTYNRDFFFLYRDSDSCVFLDNYHSNFPILVAACNWRNHIPQDRYLHCFSIVS